ncbi:MAG TPA: amino acid permease [Steroidobacteraceae bacterium]|nr:amino acid permease [Steroidobacteraceae bacterium]
MTHNPARTLSIADAIFVVVGIVIGAGIFRTPSLVAANSGSDAAFLLMWVAGGVVAAIGALCYAELASTYPSTGGDYHFLHRAFGRGPAFLFAWARITVMQTGSIALLAFAFGDYAAAALPFAGDDSAAVYAALSVVVLTLVNVRGIREGKHTQRMLTSIEVIGVIAVAIAVLALAGGAPAAAAGEAAARPASAAASFGVSMVFVLLTYGGWNEAAYVSAEVRGERAPLARALIIGIVTITSLYLLINYAFLHALGREGMAASAAVGAAAMERALGAPGIALVSVLVAVCALTSINATIITGARCNHALGRDFPPLAFLGQWDARGGTPRNALLVQGALALLLVALGAGTRSGFQTLVEYTAPVFWLFFLLTGAALLRLRRRDREASRPFRVPLYPLTPLVFCATSAWMLWSSVTYTGVGALVGVAVLVLGVPVLWMLRARTLRPVQGDHDETRPSAARVAHEHRSGD